MEEQLAELSPGTPRFDALHAARDFKASWVHFGECLTDVRENSEFKDWGYSTFDSYCRRELRIKPDTANKLTRSFSFLRDHEPQAAEAPTERELPPLEVVDLLSRARESSNVSKKDFQSIVEESFDPETMPSTRGQVVKRIRDFDPDAFKTASAKAPKGTASEADLRKALLLAERLCELLDPQDDISQGSKNCTRNVVAELRNQFESARESA
jgi:hypothetical protein